MRRTRATSKRARAAIFRAAPAGDGCWQKPDRCATPSPSSFPAYNAEATITECLKALRARDAAGRMN